MALAVRPAFGVNPNYLRLAQKLSQNPYVRQGARLAATKIQALARGYITRKFAGGQRGSVDDISMRSYGSRATGAPVHAGVVPSGSSSMRVSRPNRRRFKLPRSRFRGHNKGFRGKRRRFGRRRGRGNFLKTLWRMMHTPQEIKTTSAAYKLSSGYGLRTWNCDIVGQTYDLQNWLFVRRPTGSFTQQAGAAGVVPSVLANTAAYWGSPKRLHVTSFIRKYTIQNKCNWMMHLKVYECLLRRDVTLATATGPTAQNAFLTDMFVTAESAAINQGPIPPSFAGGSDALVNTYQNPTYTPYCSSRFCALFKVLKCTSLKLSPNDYQTYTLRLRRKVFDVERIIAANAGQIDGYLPGHGGWTKMLIFTWVGGPVDTGNLTDNNQSKSANALSLQMDSVVKFYWENRVGPLRTIVSSNARTSELPRGDSVGQYKTLTTSTYGIPYTEVVETIQAPSAVNTDDVVAYAP